MTDHSSSALDTVSFWKALADKSVKTFLQNFLVLLGAAATLTDFDFVMALSVAGLATLVTILLAVVEAPFPKVETSELGSLLLRAVRTFIGSIVSTLTVATSLHDVPWTSALSLAVIVTAASLATSLGSQKIVGTAQTIK